MNLSYYYFLFLLISIVNSAKSATSHENYENISNNDIDDNNDLASTDTIISDISSTTIESDNVTETTNSTVNEGAEIEKDNTEDAGNAEDTNDVNLIEPEETEKTTFKPNLNIIEHNPNYLRGYFGGYYFIGNDNTHLFSHGKYQEPALNYYGSYRHTLDDKSTLGYYLGYGMSKLDHNEYFRHHNFTHYDVHHYYYMNNTMLPEQLIKSEHLTFCARNTSSFCPENTEAVCLLNTTVWCVTKISFVKPCEGNVPKNCSTSRIPCVKADDLNCNQLIEIVALPCISSVTILDSYAKNGTTFINVAGTFVLVPVAPVEERRYCVTIVAEPRKN